MTDLAQRLRRIAEQVEAELDHWLPRPELTQDPSRLHEAMRYSALGGGKRVRPALCVLAAEAAGGRGERALPAGAALEMVHVYSLVHDDLPSMDDDDLRRGRPTCHKAFSEWLAILVGDGLQTRAFEVLARAYADDAPLAVDLVRLLAEAAGGEVGMVHGQALDMGAMGTHGTEPGLEELHRRKTGALLRASVLMGARAGGARPGDPTWERLDGYARAIGLAFQVADDVLDVTATTADLGKTAGKDAEQGKVTYPALLGLDGARAKARALRDEALRHLEGLPAAADPLRALARYIVDRQS